MHQPVDRSDFNALCYYWEVPPSPKGCYPSFTAVDCLYPFCIGWVSTSEIFRVRSI
jgi:hypothetical protein